MILMQELLSLKGYQYKFEEEKKNLNIFSESKEFNIMGDSTLDILLVKFI